MKVEHDIGIFTGIVLYIQGLLILFSIFVLFRFKYQQICLSLNIEVVS